MEPDLVVLHRPVPMRVRKPYTDVNASAMPTFQEEQCTSVHDQFRNHRTDVNETLSHLIAELTEIRERVKTLEARESGSGAHDTGPVPLDEFPPTVK